MNAYRVKKLQRLNLKLSNESHCYYFKVCVSIFLGIHFFKKIGMIFI